MNKQLQFRSFWLNKKRKESIILGRNHSFQGEYNERFLSISNHFRKTIDIISKSGKLLFDRH